MTEMVKAVLNGEYEIILPKHRADRPEWYTAKGWERERLAHMHSTTKPGDRVLYIGAEEGEMCALLTMWGATVCMFEPNERVWPNIKAIYDANGLTPARFLYVGFCGKTSTPHWVGYGDFGVFDSWPPCASGEVIGDHGFKELRDPGERPVMAIDDMSYGPDMISMDVEGAEWEVLQGAEQTIDRYHPRIYLSLHPEFLIDQYGKYSYEVRRWLIDKGYTETLLAYEHEAHFVYEAA